MGCKHWHWENFRARLRAGRIAALAILFVAFGAAGVFAQAPANTKLKKILVLDKANKDPNGHRESRADLNRVLGELAAEKGFAVTIIGQNDGATRIASEFSAASLAGYQAVLFSNNDGVDAQLSSTDKANFEAYVKGGGGFIPIHAASAFISNWPWLTSVLVESFFGPHGGNQPTADVTHDPEGLKEGSETKGIFKGLTAPLAFMDEYYSFRASPRGRSGVTILLTVDEKSFSKTVDGPMGNDHPVVWSKTEGKGRVLHMSMGHSWSTNNVYTAKNAYLKKYLYGALRYVAGDFLGCTDMRYREYNPDATKHDQNACVSAVDAVVATADGSSRTLISREEGMGRIRVEFQGAGRHAVTLVDVSGHVLMSGAGVGPRSYALPTPAQAGIYTVVAKGAGGESRYRMTVL